jgi:NADPH-dependent curcumin reductase CurA
MEVENRYIAVRHHVDGSPSEDDFEVKSAPVHWTAESGEVLVRNMYLSIDPGQLNRMKRHSASQQSVGAIVPGEVIMQLSTTTDRRTAIRLAGALLCVS